MVEALALCVPVEAAAVESAAAAVALATSSCHSPSLRRRRRAVGVLVLTMPAAPAKVAMDEVSLAPDRLTLHVGSAKSWLKPAIWLEKKWGGDEEIGLRRCWSRKGSAWLKLC